MRSILFYLGPVPIRAYGLMLWLALVVGIIRSARAAKKTNIKPEHVVDVGLYSLLAGVLCAHLASIVLDLPYYWGNPSEIISLWKGILSPSGGLRGLSFHGGLIGGIGAAWLYTRRKGISFLAMADLCSPGLAIGYGIARIGCFLNGCCYGIPTKLPWAVRFHLDSVSGEMTPPSHPVQIYAMLASFLIAGILIMIERRQRFKGHVFLSYLAMYSVYRFLIEFLRKGVTADVAFAGITEAQVASLVMLAITVPILAIKLKKQPAPIKIRNPKSSSAKATEDKSAIRNSKGG